MSAAQMELIAIDIHLEIVAKRIEENEMEAFRIQRRIREIESEIEPVKPVFKTSTRSNRRYDRADATPEDSEYWARECNPTLARAY